MEDRSHIIPMPGALAAWPTVVRRSSTRVLRYNASLSDEFAEALWDRPEDVIAAGELMRRTQWRSAALVDWSSRTYIMKHYFQRSLRERIKQAFGASQAWKSYQIGRTLAEAGVRTPCPVACIENRSRSFLRDSYLLYPHVEGRTLRGSINRGYMNDADIEEAWEQLKTLWQQLASLRVGLHDANTGNFIVTPSGVLWMIDLDDTCFYRSTVIARAQLQRCWFQLYRSMRRAMRTRDQHGEPLKRAA